MRVELKKLMETLGVGHVLSPYETFPWVHYDSVKGVTCSAEVRMGPAGDEVEAEVQLVYDEDKAPEPALPTVTAPPPSKYASDDVYGDSSSSSSSSSTGTGSSSGGGTGGLLFPGGPYQIMRMRAIPTEGMWEPKELRVKGDDYKNKFHNWEEKSCNFFRACVEAMQMNVMPNIEELLDKELSDDDDWGGGKRGRIGRKAPKIKPAQLMGLNKRGM